MQRRLVRRLGEGNHRIQIVRWRSPSQLERSRLQNHFRSPDGEPSSPLAISSFLILKVPREKTPRFWFQRKFPTGQETLPIMEKIEFGKEVSCIDRTSSTDLIVRTSEGQQFPATHVIFTASLGVLKEQHSKIFVPPLPPKKQLAIKVN